VLGLRILHLYEALSAAKRPKDRHCRSKFYKELLERLGKFQIGSVSTVELPVGAQGGVVERRVAPRIEHQARGITEIVRGVELEQTEPNFLRRVRDVDP